MFFFARVEPYLESIRQATSPRAFRNTEWVARNTETGRTLLHDFKARVARMLAGK
jgi:hypothetical protein